MLWAYLRQKLEIEEFRLEVFLRHMILQFLNLQTDAWIQEFCLFLNSRPTFHPQAKKLPIIRLKDGSHVSPFLNDVPQAYLPGARETDFPTVNKNVCDSEDARNFLVSLSLAEPDPVDNPIQYVLPKYRAGNAKISADEYTLDINLLLNGYATDSQKQQDKLVLELEKTLWVKAIDAEDNHSL
ncbi:MAG: hypothetical protein OXC62_10290 [Aestuariivita sp.]|nr:hypothetical protein [Aestuariivita sp.]